MVIHFTQFCTIFYIVFFSLIKMFIVCDFKSIPMYFIYTCTECEYNSLPGKICKPTSTISYWRIVLKFVFHILLIKVPSWNAIVLSYYPYINFTLKCYPTLQSYSYTKCVYEYYIIKTYTYRIKLYLCEKSISLLICIVYVKKLCIQSGAIRYQTHICVSIECAKGSFILQQLTHHANLSSYNYWRKFCEFVICEFPTRMTFSISKVTDYCDNIILHYCPIGKPFSCTKCDSELFLIIICSYFEVKTDTSSQDILLSILSKQVSSANSQTENSFPLSMLNVFISTSDPNVTRNCLVLQYNNLKKELYLIYLENYFYVIYVNLIWNLKYPVYSKSLLYYPKCVNLTIHCVYLFDIFFYYGNCDNHLSFDKHKTLLFLKYVLYKLFLIKLLLMYYHCLFG